MFSLKKSCFTVYDTSGYTIQEVLSNFQCIINEILEQVRENKITCDSAEKLLELIKNDLLPKEVKINIQELIDNGTLEQMINTLTLGKIDDLEVEIENLKELQQLNTNLYAKFLHKLRTTNESITICCIGDSMTYGTDTNSVDKRPADNIPTDNGSSHKVTRASTTYPEALQIELNKIYSNSIVVKNHGFSGDGTKKGFNHWNASGCDLAIINYGINDAINSNIDYMGDVEEFLLWYRKIIERELANKTAVILVTPPKQILVSGYEKDGRIAVDTFSLAVEMLGREYNCPVIDGNILLEGYGGVFYSDTTHLTGLGYKIYACNLLPILIGEGANKPYKINGYDMLGSNNLLDNFVLTNNAQLVKNSSYPTPSEFAGFGCGIFIKDGQSVTYSFYTEQPNMVVVPSFFSNSSNCQVVMELDRGIPQPETQNLFYTYSQSVIDRTVEEKSVIVVTNNDLVDYSNRVYSLKNLKNENNPHLKILKRGWHTITISTNFGNTTDSCTLYGLEFLTFNDYLNKVTQFVDVDMYNCEAFDTDRTPKLEIKNGHVTLTGIINNITDKSERILSFDNQYAPNTSKTFVVALSSSNTYNGYAILTVTRSGNIFMNYSSVENTTFTTLFGCSWEI